MNNSFAELSLSYSHESQNQTPEFRITVRHSETIELAFYINLKARIYRSVLTSEGWKKAGIKIPRKKNSSIAEEMYFRKKKRLVLQLSHTLISLEKFNPDLVFQCILDLFSGGGHFYNQQSVLSSKGSFFFAIADEIEEESEKIKFYESIMQHLLNG